jgi:hypothetical protein
MELMEKSENSLDDLRQRGYLVIKANTPEEIKEWEDKISCNVLLVSKARLETLLDTNLEKIKNMDEVIKILLSKLTDIAKDRLRSVIGDTNNKDELFIEKAIESATWSALFDIEERRRIIDLMTSEDKKEF